MPEGTEALLAAPVIYNRAGTYLWWEPFPQQDLKELCKAAKEFGRDSQYFRSFLLASFDPRVLVPHDLKSVMACLLSQTEYLLWERTWKRSLKDLLATYQSNPQFGGLTLDHLCGQGVWTKPQDQVANIPEAVLHNLKQAALRALQITSAAVTPKLTSCR